MPREAYETYPTEELFLDSFPKGGIAVEVGVLHGCHAYAIRHFIRPERMILIDTWGDYQNMSSGLTMRGEENMAIAKQRFWNAGDVEFWRGDSVAMTENLEDKSVSFAYIDAEHWWEECLADLEAMLPKMKNGGWLCGHDYCEIYQYGVVRAVAVFMDRHPEVRFEKLTDCKLQPVIGSERAHYQKETAYNSFGLHVCRE